MLKTQMNNYDSKKQADAAQEILERLPEFKQQIITYMICLKQCICLIWSYEVEDQI